MYFWKIEHLKGDIQQGRLNESERFKYAIVTFALTALGMEAMSFLGVDEPNVWDGVYSIGVILIEIIGILFAYKANNGPSGTDFLGKYFSISFVTSIRFLVLLIPMFIGLFVYYSIAFSLELEEEIPTTAFDTIPFLIWFAALYWRIYVHIRQTNS